MNRNEMKLNEEEKEIKKNIKKSEESWEIKDKEL